MRDLLDEYKQKYTDLGGDGSNSKAYTTQNLTRKIRDRFGEEITLKLADQRKGNFVFSSVLSEEEARRRLLEEYQPYDEENKLRRAALHLRSQILNIPKTKTPNPANVDNLKECAPDVPSWTCFSEHSSVEGVRHIQTESIAR